MNTDISKTLAALVSFAVILSIVYEWAYFSEIGTHFQLSLSVADYLLSALLWLPGLIIFTVVVLTIILFVLRARNFKIFLSPPTSKLWLVNDLKQNPSLYAVAIVQLGFLVYNFFVGPSAEVIFRTIILSGVVWGIFITYMYAHETVREVFTQNQFFAALVIPSLLTIALAAGVVDAQHDLRKVTAVYRVDFLNSRPHRSVQIIRNIEKGIILRDPVSQTVEFVKWSEIFSISRRVDPNNSSIACRLFWFSCPVYLTP